MHNWDQVVHGGFSRTSFFNDKKSRKLSNFLYANHQGEGIQHVNHSHTSGNPWIMQTTWLEGDFGQQHETYDI